MSRFLTRWLFNTVAIFLTTRIVPGIRIPEPVILNALVAALVLGVVNAFIRPILFWLTLPITLVTLGLFALVLNTLMLYLVAAVTPLSLAGFWSAFVGALLIAIISTILAHVLRP